MVRFRVIWVVRECHNSVQDECRHVAICSTAVARCQRPIVRGRYTGVILRLLEIELPSHSTEAGCRCKLVGHTDCQASTFRKHCHLTLVLYQENPMKYDVRDASLLNADEWCLPSHGNGRLTHQASLLSLKKGFAPRWNKSGIEASLFWFHATVKSTALKGAPAALVHENWQQALSINWAPNMHNQTKKSQNTMSSLQIPPYSKKARQWKVGGELCREDPFFVRWQNGGLLWDGMVIAAVTCYKEGRSGRTKEDRGYVSVHGPWDPPDGSPC